MYLVDANVLVYATDARAGQHEAARDWLDERLAGAPRYVGLPWPSLLAFLRLVTNPRIYSSPATVMQAWQRIEDWLSRPAAWIPAPGSRHPQVLSEIIREAGPTGNLVPDAHLAALAREHGLTVVSTDSDFTKFRRVAWLNPVTAEERRPSS
ncbi:MAG: TA system VapC family ribonuclease toxin [Streptosporangiaceae bacterium]